MNFENMSNFAIPLVILTDKLFFHFGHYSAQNKRNTKHLVKYYANEYMNGQKRFDYAMIAFVSDDGTIATYPAMILGFVGYNITLGIPTPQFTGEEELTLNTIQENMAVDNNLYVVVHTASDHVSSD